MTRWLRSWETPSAEDLGIVAEERGWREAVEVRAAPGGVIREPNYTSSTNGKKKPALEEKSRPIAERHDAFGEGPQFSKRTEHRPTLEIQTDVAVTHTAGASDVAGGSTPEQTATTCGLTD